MNSLIDEPNLLTAGEIAKSLGRSTYGVKKALKRLGVEPEQVLAGTSFYPARALDLLKEEMRAPNQSLAI